MTIAFAGHARIPLGEKVKERVKSQLQEILSRGVRLTCLIGGYGDFDMICACACREIKKEWDGIEILYVTPYLSCSEERKIKDLQSRGLCDASIYPPLEGVPPRLAILRRNAWMMERADLVVAYVDHAYGGAYRSLRVAEKKKKRIINLSDPDAWVQKS